MKFSEMNNEQAMNALADLIDPVSEICSKELLQLLSDRNFKGAAKKLLREHQRAVITILAVMDGEKPENYRFNPFQLLMKLIALLNDPDVVQLFTSQLQSAGAGSSGAAFAATATQG